jgi:hypothetical protein
MTDRYEAVTAGCLISLAAAALAASVDDGPDMIIQQ